MPRSIRPKRAKGGIVVGRSLRANGGFMACPNERLSLRQTDESNAATREPAHAIRGVMSREAVSLVSGVLHRLAPSRMQLVDTVKMIAYRAETAMTSVVRDARSLLSDLFRSATDLVPDLEQQLLRVGVHPMSNPRSNRAIAHVLHVLNESDFTYPGTSLRLVYSLAGTADSLVLVATRRNRTLVEQNPAGQEV
jgi:hypothetical protein